MRRLEVGARVCELLGLDPQRVSSVGFDLGAAGPTRVRVELLVDDELSHRIALVLLSNHDHDHDQS